MSTRIYLKVYLNNGEMLYSDHMNVDEIPVEVDVDPEEYFIDTIADVVGKGNGSLTVQGTDNKTHIVNVKDILRIEIQTYGDDDENPGGGEESSNQHITH